MCSPPPQHCYWGVDPKKGNAGTAILSKLKPLEVTFGLPTTTEPQSESAGSEFSLAACSSVFDRGSSGKGIITLEFESTFVVGTYVVNAGAALKVRRTSPLSLALALMWLADHGQEGGVERCV